MLAVAATLPVLQRWIQVETLQLQCLSADPGMDITMEIGKL